MTIAPNFTDTRMRVSQVRPFRLSLLPPRKAPSRARILISITPRERTRVRRCGFTGVGVGGEVADLQATRL